MPNQANMKRLLIAEKASYEYFRINVLLVLAVWSNRIQSMGVGLKQAADLIE